MKKDHSNHPAVIFGKWLKEKRRAKNFVMISFANLIKANSSKYSQIEMGLGDWIDDHFLNVISTALEFTDKEISEMNIMYQDYIESQILQMEDLFTRDEMRPAFPPCKGWTLEREEKLLDAVFKPLDENTSLWTYKE